jgi:signal transduction histidine kinase
MALDFNQRASLENALRGLSKKEISQLRQLMEALCSNCPSLCGDSPSNPATPAIDEFFQTLFSPVVRMKDALAVKGAAMRRLNELREKESKRIAYALHSEAAQLLASVHLALAEMAQDVPAECHDKLRQVHELLDGTEKELRRLSHELSPTALHEHGLLPALEFLISGISHRTGAQIVISGSTGGRLPSYIETAAYRFVQEALNNAAKHAHAGSIHVEIRRAVRAIHCCVCDDGAGFDLRRYRRNRGERGIGLIEMRERIEGLGGRFTVSSRQNCGTSLSASIPLEQSDLASHPVRAARRRPNGSAARAGR